MPTCPLGNQHTWKLESDGTDSVGTLNLDPQNSPSFEAGKINNAVRLDRINQYLKQDIASFRGSDNVGCFSCWINLDSLGTTNIQNIVGTTDSSAGVDNQVRLVYNEDANVINLNTRSGGVTNEVEFTTTVINSTGTWFHLLIGSDGAQFLGWINAVSQTVGINAGANNGTWFNDMTVAQDKISIGAHFFNGSGYIQLFEGFIDHVSYYNVTPTQSMADDLYNAGAGLDCPLEQIDEPVRFYTAPVEYSELVAVNEVVRFYTAPIEYTEVTNTAPTGTPNPLNKTLAEGTAWTTDNTIVFDDVDVESITITKTAGTIPAWVTEDLTFPHVEADGNVTLTLGGTPPFTGAGSSSGSPYSWSYDVDDGTNPPVTVTVNLTVTNVSTNPTATPDPLTINVVEGGTANGVINVTDAESETVDITITGGAEPGFLARDKALSPTEHATPVNVTLTATPVPGDAAGSPYTVQYTFTDESGDTDVVNVTINVSTASPLVSGIGHFEPTSALQGLVARRNRIIRKGF